MAFFPISPIPQAGGNFLASMSSAMFSWCALSPTKILMAYCQASPMKLYVQVLNFNGIGAPTLGPATYVGDITGTPDQENLKVASFDASTALLMWIPITNTLASVQYNVCVLNIDASDNINWNPATSFTENGRANGFPGTFVSGLSSTTAIMAHSSNNSINDSGNIRRVTRTGNSLTVVSTSPTFAGTTNWYSQISFFKKLPTEGIVGIYSNVSGSGRHINFANSTATTVIIPGISKNDVGEVVCPMSDNLIHVFRTYAAGTILVRPLDLNMTALTGNWITTQQNYNITGWPGSLTFLDMLPLDSEYFLMMAGSSAASISNAYATTTYHYCVGRYLSTTNSYVFADRFTAATPGVPLWGGRHLHMINPTTIASFAIQGAAGNQQLGVNILYL